MKFFIIERKLLRGPNCLSEVFGLRHWGGGS